MPHKRNPVSCAVVLAAAARIPPLVATMLAAMPQEHERAVGGWQAEWETLPQIFRLTAGALAQMRLMLDGIEIDSARMTANLQLTNGLLLAESVSGELTKYLGRSAAHRLVEDASKRAIAEGRPLESILREVPEVTQHLTSVQLHELFDYRDYLGSSREMIRRTLRALESEED